MSLENICYCRNTSRYIIVLKRLKHSKMFKIKKLVCKTNIFKIPAIQCCPSTHKKRYINTGKIENSELKVETKDSRKRLVNHCILMGYSGSKYKGMQYQTHENVETVDGILFKAMLENKWIKPASYKQPKIIKYQHASRTDKGVSAARQCCSILLPAGLDVQEVNNKLPDDVRVFGLKRVTEKFNARYYCMARTYTYTIPSIGFCHFNDQVSHREYRLSSDKLKLINELLQVYNGSKNFHNFTIEKTFSDASSLRHMKHLECEPPFLVDDIEFCVIRIRGNSFMMHQIRKMMGLILAVIRDVIDSSIFDVTFTEKLINCPTAPALGLVLDRLHYDEYDEKCGSDGQYEKLTWNECDENVKQFHEKFIQSNIVRTEIHTEHMLEWVENLLNYPYFPMINSDSFATSHKGYI